MVKKQGQHKAWTKPLQVLITYQVITDAVIEPKTKA